MSGRRTLLRAGLRAHLVRIESREGVRFYVGGPKLGEHHDFTDLPEATAWFLAVERGEQPARAGKKRVGQPSRKRPAAMPERTASAKASTPRLALSIAWGSSGPRSANFS